ncbi:hypothetical protein KUCAC02_026271 [Chaenocephalus aceratus]|uniref:Uncharacterized protein n=1 Tax=Chaenocephalus aceratus TaxID=36190 RepID=A0ACB9VW51_CHAAC|nr:hypothetical protein KUCAC02_026271 [Chaenocephalus aceratus]
MDTPRGPEGMSGGPGAGGSTSSSSSSNSSSSFTPVASRQEEGPKEKQEPPEAEYLTSRCVLFSYYQGDISSVVDEHFSRALSSYMDGESKRRAADQPGTDTPSPSRSRRSFPPSFWDSNYSPPQSRSHCETALDPHYGPLLMPTVRPPHPLTLQSHYEVSKLDPTASWPSLLPPGDLSQTLALNMDAGLQQHKKGKELYWF